MKDNQCLVMAALLALAGCGGEGSTALFSGLARSGSPPGQDPCPHAESCSSARARVDTLPITSEHTVLDRLSDSGRASGYHYLFTPDDAQHLPVSVAAGDTGIASEASFFGNDPTQWTRLRTGSANNSGLISGYGIVNQQPVVWTWSGHPVIPNVLPADTWVEKVIGPADDGSFVVDSYNGSTVKQQILLWRPEGSYSSIYQITPIKAGMTLVGMASNGLIGAVERDGYLLTPKIYDGQWKSLSFDYTQCACEAVRVNAEGQMLMSPRFDLDPDARGYLIGSGHATVLPRLGLNTTYADLNNAGDIVGHSGNTAIIIINGLLHDLNTYADSAALGWHFNSAVAINNRRQIVGLGTRQGQQRWYLLTLK
jgi:hypothetical protein